MEKKISPEEIEANWNKFRKYMTTKLGDRNVAGQALCDGLEERLALCPGSSNINYHNAFPGGLVEHSLRVLKFAIKISKEFGWNKLIDNDSLIIGCLLHDLGKVGDHIYDNYVPNDSDWHVKNLGKVYKYNDDPKMQWMTVPDRGVWLCQHYGLKLSQAEFLAIMLNDGHYDETNRPYRLKEPTLALLVHHADIMATRFEKGFDQPEISKEEN